MGTFRKVEAEQAGPDALGILIPPSRRTFVILRPRGLPWDLLLCRGADDLSFAQLAHDEASACAVKLYRALGEWVAGGPGGIEAVNSARSPGCRLRVVVGPFSLVVCPRTPGQPYAPLLFRDAETAPAAASLASVLCPPSGAEQELYFNTRFFER